MQCIARVNAALCIFSTTDMLYCNEVCLEEVYVVLNTCSSILIKCRINQSKYLIQIQDR